MRREAGLSTGQPAPFRAVRLLAAGLLALLGLLEAAPLRAADPSPSVAFHYGAHAPLDALKAFDIVVVEPDHGHDPQRYRARQSYSALYAYVSVGEVHPRRAGAADLPASLFLTENADWDSRVVDLAHPEWPALLAERIVAPLWARGYRGFFLDTLDSYRLAPGVNEAAQQAGLVAVIETLHRRFPGIALILNRGFEVLPRVRDKVRMVAAESLFAGWDARRQRYVEVAEADREWLLARLREARDTHGLPVLAIDYLPPHERARMRATAERIRALGIVPWVTDSALATLGIGRHEAMPRKVLMLYSSEEAPLLHQTQAVRFATMPLQHMGYVPEYLDVRAPLPERSFAGEAAGIVLWINGQPKDPLALARWLRRQMADGLRVAVFGQLGPALDGRLRELGLENAGTPTAGALRVATQDPMLGLEAPPRPDRALLRPLRLAGGERRGDGRPLLRVADARGGLFDAAALTAWGGYVLDPFVIAMVPGTEQARWVVNPFAFLRAALALPEMPVPDTTTENGRRLMFIHIDGDGFPSLSERAGAPVAGRVLLDEVIARYRLPTTMSVIEGETAPHGLFPKLSPELENVARRIFALPWVEIASHTYSHPFDWLRARLGEAPTGEDDAYHLPLPGYRPDLEREIAGSIRYIESRLAPPGKRVAILLWSGDAEPEAEALRQTAEIGVLNMNGGNTVITRDFPSLSAVSALGVPLGGVFQTYAPVMNENVYTNIWNGPFYGFERVIETFELTDAPRRLKPIDIYYHSYSASKRASLAALHKVYGWALAQSPHVIHASAFIRKALDFNTVSIARDGDAWRVRGDGELRTLRVPPALGTPDPAHSQGIAGHRPGGEGHYAHLDGAEATLRLSPAPAPQPYLYDANARLTAHARGDDGLRFTLSGHQPLEFALALPPPCQLRLNGKPLAPRRTAGELRHYALNHAAATLEARCDAR